MIFMGLVLFARALLFCPKNSAEGFFRKTKAVRNSYKVYNEELWEPTHKANRSLWTEKMGADILA